MDITPFYELKNRLYYTASAGCSTINEDFRLKRAVENFKSLSTVNKPFTKLYMMCENLFKTDSKNVASELSECIALSDALAVVQGTYNDTSETKKSENNIRLKPFNLPYSEYHSMIESIQKPSSYMIFNNLNANQIKFVLDPRMIMVFIEKIKKNTNSEYFETFINFVLKMYGNEIIPLFKKNINLDDPKNNGNMIKYVSSVAGADENEWYAEMAKNENNPTGVRVAAIKALSFSYDNVDLLMELYHTEKGKIKNTVMESLAVLSPPEADEIWKKMTVSLEKFKSTNFKYISLSKSEVCKKFAVAYIYDHMEQISNMKKTEYEKSKLNFLDDIEILNNKTGDDIEECILKIIEFLDKHKNVVQKSYMYNLFSNMFINNIEKHPDDKSCRDMLSNLYEKNPDAFCRAEFYANLRDNPKKAFEDAEKLPIEQRSNIIDILRNIWYSNADNMYYVKATVDYSFSRLNSVPLFESLPEYMLDFLKNTEILEKSAFTENAEIILENMGIKNKSIYNAKYNYCNNISGFFHTGLSNNHFSPSDEKRIIKCASEFIFATTHKYPNIRNIYLIEYGCKSENPEKYKDIVYNIIKTFINEKSSINNYYASNAIRAIDVFPLTDDEKISEWEKVKKLLKSCKLNQYISYFIQTIDAYIKGYKNNNNA